ncbi:MAG: hypothetical protein GY759_13185 [Chloroflexi bacterium]|nr:hypothetical protein [Chloroflexota bacterium]
MLTKLAFLDGAESAAGSGTYTRADDFDSAKVVSNESEFNQPSIVHMYSGGATLECVNDISANRPTSALSPP